jgi:uncharacterized membrane protein
MLKTLGNKFVLFVAILAVATPAAAWVFHHYAADPWREAGAKGLLAGFDLAAILFLLATLHLLKVHDQAQMRAHAAANDANRTTLLILTVIISAAVFAAVATMLESASGWKTKGLIIGTLGVAWLFANSIFALHYAHLCVKRGGGIDFPGEEPPGYADFVYFSFTLGMTFQTSDVAITAPPLRRAVLLHSFGAFVFNIGVIAFAINALGS